MHDGVHLADMGQKFISQPFALACPLYKACDIYKLDYGRGVFFGMVHFRKTVKPFIRNGHYAYIGLNGAEGIVGCLRTGMGYGVEKRAFAYIGQAYDSEFHCFPSRPCAGHGLCADNNNILCCMGLFAFYARAD